MPLVQNATHSSLTPRINYIIYYWISFYFFTDKWRSSLFLSLIFCSLPLHVVFSMAHCTLLFYVLILVWDEATCSFAQHCSHKQHNYRLCGNLFWIAHPKILSTIGEYCENETFALNECVRQRLFRLFVMKCFPFWLHLIWNFHWVDVCMR